MCFKIKFISGIILLFFLIILPGCGKRISEEEKLKNYYQEVKSYSSKIDLIVKQVNDGKLSNQDAFKELKLIMGKFDKLDPKIEALNFGEETGEEGAELRELLLMAMFNEAYQYVGFEPQKVEFKITAENKKEILIFAKEVLAETAKTLYNTAMLFAQKCGSADSQAGSSAYSMTTNESFLTLAGEMTRDNAIYSIDVLNFIFKKLDEVKVDN